MMFVFDVWLHKSCNKSRHGSMKRRSMAFMGGFLARVGITISI